MRACLDDQNQMITDLIEGHAKIDAVDNVKIIIFITIISSKLSIYFQWGRTALHYTASNGNLIAMKLLVNAGANIRLLDYV